MFVSSMLLLCVLQLPKHLSLTEAQMPVLGSFAMGCFIHSQRENIIGLWGRERRAGGVYLIIYGNTRFRF